MYFYRMQTLSVWLVFHKQLVPSKEKYRLNATYNPLSLSPRKIEQNKYVHVVLDAMCKCLYVSHYFISKGANSWDLVNIYCYNITFHPGIFIPWSALLKNVWTILINVYENNVLNLIKRQKSYNLRTLVGRIRYFHVLLYLTCCIYVVSCTVLDIWS